MSTLEPKPVPRVRRLRLLSLTAFREVLRVVLYACRQAAHRGEEQTSRRLPNATHTGVTGQFYDMSVVLNSRSGTCSIERRPGEVYSRTPRPTLAHVCGERKERAHNLTQCHGSPHMELLGAHAWPTSRLFGMRGGPMKTHQNTLEGHNGPFRTTGNLPAIMARPAPLGTLSAWLYATQGVV